MKKVLVMALVFALTFVLGYASPVPAQQSEYKKIPCTPGTHYTLNIIGVEKSKTAPMTNSNRHTIFVGLGKKSTVTTNIYLQPGDFTVCDGNGFDPAYGCDGNPDPIKPFGATFRLPCNENLNNTSTESPCQDIYSRSYYVFVRPLGKPGGFASMKTWACFLDESSEVICEVSQLELPLQRNNGRSVWKNATDELTSFYFDGQTIPLFGTGYQDFFWEYTNDGLKHAQIRFYPAANCTP